MRRLVYMKRRATCLPGPQGRVHVENTDGTRPSIDPDVNELEFKIIIYPGVNRKDIHIIEYIQLFNSKGGKRVSFPSERGARELKRLINTSIEMPKIYYNDTTITIKFNSIKTVIPLKGIYTRNLLDSYSSNLYQSVCLLAKLSNLNTFWSQRISDITKTISKSTSAINIFSSSIMPIDKSQFTLDTRNEFNCSFNTFKCIPVFGTYYAIIDIDRFPDLFERTLIHFAYSKLSINERHHSQNSNISNYTSLPLAEEKRSRFVNLNTYIYIIFSNISTIQNITFKNQIVLKLLTQLRHFRDKPIKDLPSRPQGGPTEKLQSQDAKSLFDLIASHDQHMIDDLFTIRDCSVEKLSPVNVVRIDV